MKATPKEAYIETLDSQIDALKREIHNNEEAIRHNEEAIRQAKIHLAELYMKREEEE